MNRLIVMDKGRIIEGGPQAAVASWRTLCLGQADGVLGIDDGNN